jgi:hypothetical protein
MLATGMVINREKEAAWLTSANAVKNGMNGKKTGKAGARKGKKPGKKGVTNARTKGKKGARIEANEIDHETEAGRMWPAS